jgi:hypothetical protein
MRVSWRLRAAVVTALAIACVGLPVQTQAATSAVNWEQESPAASPWARTFAASAYDSSRNRVVIFGGSMSGGGADFSDTWEWDGSTWSNHSQFVGPRPSGGAAMAYDSARRVSVLFVGQTPDTWEWDGTTWTQPTATSPPPMIWPAMVYDSTRDRIVLFGFTYPFGSFAATAETWEFDGSTWTQAQPAASPSPREGAAMAFDSTRNRAVLFGGFDTNNGRMADTWEWDGTNWSQMRPSISPSARFWHSMAYDPVRDRVILFGGDHIQPYSLGDVNDTWEWDGAQWTRDWTAAAPSVRAGQSMVYDSFLGRMVLFGGFNAGVTPNTYSNETWELGTGIVTPPGSPQLTVSPTSAELGSVDTGATSSSPAVFGITSSGTRPAVTAISVTGDFGVSFTDCPGAADPLAAGTSCLLFVTFSPTAVGDRYGSLTLTGNIPGGSVSIPLHGVGLARDFTISVNPSTINATQGYPIPPITVSTTTIGDTGTISLSFLTNGTAFGASIGPSVIPSGSDSTLTIFPPPGTQPGTYAVFVVGAEGTITHSAEISIQILPPPDFTIGTDPTAITLPHGTSSRIAITSTSINAVGSIGLSTSVSPVGLIATLDSPNMTAGGIGFVTITALFGVPPGSYTVTVTGTEGANVHSTTIAVTVTTNGLVNGGFETGDLTGWTQSGVDAVINYPHSGTYSGQVGNPGSPTPFMGDSTLSQTFDVPASAGKLVFWYRNFCSDKVKNDWFTATLQDGVTGATTTVVAPVCTKNGTWTKVVVNLSSHAGHYVTLTFLDHEGSTTSNTFTLVDDVALT